MIEIQINSLRYLAGRNKSVKLMLGCFSAKIFKYMCFDVFILNSLYIHNGHTQQPFLLLVCF